MSQIVVKGEMSDTLAAISGEADLVDESGRLLGHFIRVAPDTDPQKIDWPRADFPAISEEEIQRRRKQSCGRTLAEIWKSLGVNS